MLAPTHIQNNKFRISHIIFDPQKLKRAGIAPRPELQGLTLLSILVPVRINAFLAGDVLLPGTEPDLVNFGCWLSCPAFLAEPFGPVVFQRMVGGFHIKKGLELPPNYIIETSPPVANLSHSTSKRAEDMLSALK